MFEMYLGEVPADVIMFRTNDFRLKVELSNLCCFQFFLKIKIIESHWSLPIIRNIPSVLIMTRNFSSYRVKKNVIIKLNQGKT